MRIKTKNKKARLNIPGFFTFDYYNKPSHAKKLYQNCLENHLPQQIE